jgi:hypothetical protein
MTALKYKIMIHDRKQWVSHSMVKLVVFAVLLIPQCTMAIGITPGRVYADTMVVGEPRTFQITVVSAPKETSQTFSSIIEGGTSTIHIDIQADEIVIPPGEQRVTVPFVVTVSTSTPLTEVLLTFVKNNTTTDVSGNLVRYGIAARVFVATTDAYTPPKEREIDGSQFPQDVQSQEQVFSEDTSAESSTRVIYILVSVLAGVVCGILYIYIVYGKART